MSKTLTYSGFRKNLAGVMDEVNRDSVVYTVSRRGAGSMVVMSEADFNSMQETLYLLSNPANAAHLHESLEQAREGNLVDVDL